MKVIRMIMDFLTLISAILCLYTIISSSLDIIVYNETFLKILFLNLFACPILTIILCVDMFNREGDKKNG